MSPSQPIGIVGLGYVGLPLGLHFAERGSKVLGFDVDPAKVEQLNRGASYIHHIPAERIIKMRDEERFAATVEFSRVHECSAVILCVPTPLRGEREPDLSYILNTGREIAPHLRQGMLVVLESTTYPGTTEEELLPVLEQGSGLRAGVDFHLAYSPEREDPGNPSSNVGVIPKVVGGLTPACCKMACELYARVVAKVVPVSSCRVAEAAKLTENIFRAVNIAMVNELKVVYSAMGIDIWEVIEAARTKPFGFMPFYPGPGLGGHCIPIDPFYLTWKARQYGQHTKFIELAGEVNTGMPAYVVQRLKVALEERGKTIAQAKVLLLGIAYKANVDDDRESPAYVIWNLLEEAKAQVAYHDPFVPVIRPSREHAHFAGRRSVHLDAVTLKSCDAVILITKHAGVDYELVAKEANLIVDTRNGFPQLHGDPRLIRA